MPFDLRGKAHWSKSPLSAWRTISNSENSKRASSTSLVTECQKWKMFLRNYSTKLGYARIEGSKLLSRLVFCDLKTNPSVLDASLGFQALKSRLLDSVATVARHSASQWTHYASRWTLCSGTRLRPNAPPLRRTLPRRDI